MLAENWQVWTSPAQLLVDSNRKADLAAASAAVRGLLSETNAAINTFESTSITNTLTTYHYEITAHTHGTCTAHS